MKPAALAGLGLIGVLALGTAQAQTPTVPDPVPAPTARPDGRPAPARPDGRHESRQEGRQEGRQETRQDARPETRQDGRGAGPAETGAQATRPAGTERAATPRRRRPSYAACNRASQRRSLHGGARRRFLIRCRLGYERIQPGQPARAKPSQP
ncbi:hypothetical protein FF100_10680 [Methylobacterium terricola]|uniref:Serine/threonine protein kinase n=1 Tax=Methylobacterium terricola TaxID=2583531 RepID=A0A5C4LJP7_9HYPH|nr:hypothetical protein [Methylobacterium terricola]TNC13281.1 hypothetical protein FF100_10680 [Methylobacterium terricola]